MVAKSYQNLEILDEPHEKTAARSSHPAMYVTVRTKTGTTKEVRWYTDKEYAKMYPGDVIVTDNTVTLRPLKEVLGFDKGYITIFKGNTYEDKEYFKLNAARYNRLWGWYFVSTDELPTDIPEDVEPLQLAWNLVSKDDNTLLPEDEVTAAVENLIYEPDDSEYQGEVGDKLELIVIVEKAITLDSFYGASTMHVMYDYDGNCYVWTTSARSWEPQTEHHIIGTVKDHKLYKGTKQTVLTRCRSLD